MLAVVPRTALPTGGTSTSTSTGSGGGVGVGVVRVSGSIANVQRRNGCQRCPFSRTVACMPMPCPATHPPSPGCDAETLEIPKVLRIGVIAESASKQLYLEMWEARGVRINKSSTSVTEAPYGDRTTESEEGDSRITDSDGNVWNRVASVKLSAAWGDDCLEWIPELNCLIGFSLPPGVNPPVCVISSITVVEETATHATFECKTNQVATSTAAQCYYSVVATWGRDSQNNPVMVACIKNDHLLFISPRSLEIVCTLHVPARASILDCMCFNSLKSQALFLWNPTYWSAVNFQDRTPSAIPLPNTNMWAITKAAMFNNIQISAWGDYLLLSAMYQAFVLHTDSDFSGNWTVIAKWKCNPDSSSGPIVRVILIPYTQKAILEIGSTMDANEKKSMLMWDWGNNDPATNTKDLNPLILGAD
ncbi:hypothetical protein Pelo_7212 [Pelomyxa schiedti]|nr:hypothetical protein Pelo_7212 [Pelomyxa schiedti]